MASSDSGAGQRLGESLQRTARSSDQDTVAFEGSSLMVFDTALPQLPQSYFGGSGLWSREEAPGPHRQDAALTAVFTNSRAGHGPFLTPGAAPAASARAGSKL